MIKLNPEVKDEMLDASEAAVDAVVDGVRDGFLEANEGRDILVDLLAGLADALIPTGPADPFDDDLIRTGVDKALEAAEAAIGKVARRDPVRMRERAASLTAKGKISRAERLLERAAKVEARQRRP